MAQSEIPASWPLPPDDAPTLGNGRFRLAAQLGEGGMARVYRGWDTQTEMWVAVKVLLPEFATKRKLRRRFMNEAKTMLGLDHRHVVKVLAVAEEREDHPFIAMELADGGCVIDWVETYGAMPPRMAIDVVLQACKGLKAAHDQNIVHRDVKPHNILISRRGVCRLTDFGIARIDDESGGGMTRTGSVMGTLGYMAPEQRTDSKAVDIRADIYGMGATLYKLLTTGTPTDLFLAEHDATILEGVPDPLVPVLIKATAYDRDDRHGTITELAKELHGIKRTLPPDPADTPALALQMDTGVDTTLTTGQELSEPTLPVLPELDHDPPSYSADSDLEPDTDTRSIIPYQMPKQDDRVSDDDYVPDYLDRDSLNHQDFGPEEIGVDEETKRLAEEATRQAIEAGLLNPDGTPIAEEAVAVEGPETEKWNPGDTAADMAQTAAKQILGVFLRPLQALLMAGLVAVAAFTVLVGTSATSVNSAMLDSNEARARVFRSLDDNEILLGDLDAMGANAREIEPFWVDYQEETDKEKKIERAYLLISRLKNSFEYQIQHGEPSGGRVRVVRERLGRIDQAIAGYEEALLYWEEKATTGSGQIAVSVGVARRPGE